MADNNNKIPNEMHQPQTETPSSVNTAEPLLFANQQQPMTAELQDIISELKKYERQNVILIRTNECLMAQVNSLQQQLNSLQQQVNYTNIATEKADIGVQVDESDLQSAILPVWSVGTRASQVCNTESTSLADSIKATAEAAVQNTGLVFEPTSGMYYDYNSGYYYDNERALYYEPHYGIYYYFNEISQQYEMHSQVDLSHNTTHTSNTTCVPSVNTDGQTDNTQQVSDGTVTTSKKCRKHGRKQTIVWRSSGRTNTSTIRMNETLRGSDHGPGPPQILGVGKNEEGCEGEESGKHMDVAEGEESCKHVDVAELENHTESNRPLIQTDSHDTQTLDESHEMEDSEWCESVIISGTANCESMSEVRVTEGSTGHGDCEHDHSVVHCTISDQCGTSSQPLAGGSESECESRHSSCSADEDQCTCDIDEGEANAANYPPCIRVIVQSSDVLDPGGVQIITYLGGTIGSGDSSHSVSIPHPQVHTTYASIRYDESVKTYLISSQQCTTLLNHLHIYAMCEVCISHGDLITVGSTDLLLHMHPGTETCDDCEPGQIQAQLKADQPREVVILTKQDKKMEMRKQKKNLMKKYGLANAPYEHFNPSTSAVHYSDRASERRRLVGSDVAIQKSVAPASVMQPIGVENKGRKMLEKLGWSEGDGLGKMGCGLTEPVQVNLRVNQRSGLGRSECISTSLDNVKSARAAARQMTTRERYDRLSQDDAVDVEVKGSSVVMAPDDRVLWVRGGTESFT